MRYAVSVLVAAAVAALTGCSTPTKLADGAFKYTSGGQFLNKRVLADVKFTRVAADGTVFQTEFKRSDTDQTGVSEKAIDAIRGYMTVQSALSAYSVPAQANADTAIRLTVPELIELSRTVRAGGTLTPAQSNAVANVASNGTSTVTTPVVPEASRSHTTLWKAKSDSDGKCVIVLGCDIRLTDFAVPPTSGGVLINGAADQVTRAYGYANGDRANLRLRQGGAAYGAPVVIVLKLKTGDITHTVPNGATPRVEWRTW